LFKGWIEKEESKRALERNNERPRGLPQWDPRDATVTRESDGGKGLGLR
jgi:hypothetical protein